MDNEGKGDEKMSESWLGKDIVTCVYALLQKTCPVARILSHVRIKSGLSECQRNGIRLAGIASTKGRCCYGHRKDERIEAHDHSNPVIVADCTLLPQHDVPAHLAMEPPLLLP